MANSTEEGKPTLEATMLKYEKLFKEANEDKKTHRMRMIETCKKFVDDPEIPTYNKIEARIGLAMAQMELYGPEKYLDETKRTFYVVTEELGGLKKNYFQDPKWAGPIKHLEDLMGSVVMAILVESQNVKNENVAQENSEASQEFHDL